jgi:hypothetical protein
MSSAVLSTSAALSRHFVFEDEADAEVRPQANPSRTSLNRSVLGGCPHINLPAKIPSASVTSASRLAIRPAPEMVTSGIPALDALTGGLPRGCLTEICGPASSGRTSVLLAALAAATGRGEFCVVVDASDALDPHSAAAAGVKLDHLLWVRCGETSPQKQPSTHCLEQTLRATDLLLESGGFGLIVLDLSDLSPQAARRIPLTTWFRFRRAVENRPTILLAIEQQPIAGSCSSLLLQLGEQDDRISMQTEGDVPNAKVVHPSHPNLFTGLHINAELIRSRLNRKPSQSVAFETKTAWAG